MSEESKTDGNKIGVAIVFCGCVAGAIYGEVNGIELPLLWVGAVIAFYLYNNKLNVRGE